MTADLHVGKLPILQAEAPGDPARWRGLVAEHGALLVRGLGLRDAAEAEAVFRRMGSLVTEREAFAPRRRYAEGVYSSSKWPPNQPMCMHHELSYALEPPGLMLFACLVAPGDGRGATPVADSPSVLEALPAELVARFERTGWLLVRNYNEDIGASIAESFGTDDHRAVEAYCRAHAIGFEWLPGGLHTWQRCSAVVRHPRTGQRCWFNQIAFLSQWTMDPEVREYILDTYGEHGLPFDTRFGNGDPIAADIVEVINEAYATCTTREPWQAGDLLLVDNVRTAHGREAFEGPRDIVVAMADAVRVTAG